MHVNVHVLNTPPFYSTCLHMYGEVNFDKCIAEHTHTRTCTCTCIHRKINGPQSCIYMYMYMYTCICPLGCDVVVLFVTGWGSAIELYHCIKSCHTSSCMCVCNVHVHVHTGIASTKDVCIVALRAAVMKLHVCVCLCTCRGVVGRHTVWITIEMS